MDLAKLGLQTQQILRDGRYAVNDQSVELNALIDDAVQSTVLYRPADVLPPVDGSRNFTVEVTGESTLAAAFRLRDENPVALNFASARNPGGGWLSGARAQEESLGRASALVPCLESKPDYYAANRAERSCLYTDHLIYSPRVPVFRDDARVLLAQPWRCAFITSPAPNHGAVARNTPEDVPQVVPTFTRRGRQVLRVAAAQGHRTVILGAWGCGAFRGDPAQVAEVFAQLLGEPWPFERVVFAILGGRPGQNTLEHFQRLTR